MTAGSPGMCLNGLLIAVVKCECVLCRNPCARVNGTTRAYLERPLGPQRSLQISCPVGK